MDKYFFDYQSLILVVRWHLESLEELAKLTKG